MHLLHSTDTYTQHGRPHLLRMCQQPHSRYQYGDLKQHSLLRLRCLAEPDRGVLQATG